MTTETETADNALCAVIYADGGCRPTSRGQAGWGIHGYIYQNIPAKQGTGCKVLVTPTGYDMTQTGKPNISLVSYIDSFGAISGVSTNNAAEVTALIRALELCLRENVKELMVRTDSQYTINGYTSWMYGWQKRQWKDQSGGPIANQELWIRAHALSQEMANAGCKVSLKHVKGHEGELGNETADSLATAGVMSGFNNIFEEILEVVEAKGYWNTSRDYNRMLSHPFRYFSTQDHVPVKTSDGRYIYYTGKMKRDDLEMIGKKISDSSLAILYLRDQEPVLETISECMRNMAVGTYQGMLIADMSEILNPKQYEKLTQFKSRLLLKNVVDRRLIDGPSDKLLCEEARPPFLAFRLVDTLASMEQYFQHYLNGQSQFVTTTDITDILYEASVVGKDDKAKTIVKLKSSINPGLRTVKVATNYAKSDGGVGVSDLTLTLDLDIPDRNTLSAIAAEGIKVTMVTWAESDCAFRYATVIEVNGDAAFWAGAYANLKIVAS